VVQVPTTDLCIDRYLFPPPHLTDQLALATHSKIMEASVIGPVNTGDISPGPNEDDSVRASDPVVQVWMG
jgi:hypothetical protein